VRRFCQVQGYSEKSTDHWYYDKMLPGGLRSHTKVSFGHDGEQVPPELWRRVWSQQLRLKSEKDFWRGLAGEDGVVEYDVPPSPVITGRLPDYLARHLREVRHFSAAQISMMTLEDAQALLNEYYASDMTEPDDGDGS